ncbi:ABC transporter permease [Uliginosibacterium sp. H1]|uniref:ABC transporter permease n=1 Tax=Uliginosibacterium sp. H1 TaxID=3114757 RepID=UPI002E170F03|nr:ABC transporter permease [Uliginosibacterium sp. H1]
MWRSIWKNRGLILQMMRRDIAGRYRGSVMGLAWSFVTPVILLTTYAVVFSFVFNARWGVGLQQSRLDYAMLLFAGMIVHSLVAETIVRAPMLVVSNVSYVKKIVFPLEILPLVAVGTALFHAAISLLVLMIAMAFSVGHLPASALLLPFVWAPLVVLVLGAAWALASLGVFLRDIAQPIGLFMTVLLFASPVFYPLSALPAAVQPWVMLNPLTFAIEQSRAVLLAGQAPYWGGLVIYSLVAAACAWCGYAWFQKTRKGFANVL